MVESKPLFGFGWSTYTQDVTPYYRLAPSYPVTQIGGIHNVFLANLVSLGVLGTGLWVLGLLLGVCGPLMRRGPPGAQRLWWSMLLGVSVCWLVVANFTPQDYAFANASLWLIAGITYSLSRGEPVPALETLGEPEHPIVIMPRLKTAHDVRAAGRA
jgi:O-antigen ligase